MAQIYEPIMPNFVFCVAHFCEIHGPVTVLCTQKQEIGTSLPKSSNALCESCSLDLPEGVTSLVTKADEPNNFKCQAPVSELHLRKTLAVSGKFDDEPVPDANTTIADKGIDQSARKRIVYASTLYPQSESIYTSLTKLVMKCLSVEAVAEPLKPVFFGDTNTGYCLSKVFSIPDIHARGGERKYALMVVSDSETSLLKNWDISSTYIAEIILLLQRKVELQIEQRKVNSGDNVRFLRRAKTIPRSIGQLTGDNEIFMKLHLCGTEVLRNMVA